MLCTCTTYAWSIMSFILNSPNTLCLIYIFFIISNQLCLHSAIISTLRWAPFSHTCWLQCCFTVKQSQMIFCWETSIFNERIGGSIVVSRTSDSLMCLLFDYTAAELWERKKKHWSCDLVYNKYKDSGVHSEWAGCGCCNRLVQKKEKLWGKLLCNQVNVELPGQIWTQGYSVCITVCRSHIHTSASLIVLYSKLTKQTKLYIIKFFF